MTRTPGFRGVTIAIVSAIGLLIAGPGGRRCGCRGGARGGGGRCGGGTSSRPAPQPALESGRRPRPSGRHPNPAVARRRRRDRPRGRTPRPVGKLAARTRASVQEAPGEAQDDRQDYYDDWDDNWYHDDDYGEALVVGVTVGAVVAGGGLRR